MCLIALDISKEVKVCGCYRY